MEKANDLGALWIKSSTKGQYMTGTIKINGETTNIVCFLNSNKKEAKHPDWKILKSVPKSDNQPENALPVADDELNPNDIPFN
jgi:hypothetical protein